jgi:plasmid stabilization system protein ParE
MSDGQVVILEVAADELREAVRWYQAQRQGLGGEFSRAVRGCIDAIRRNPGGYPAAFGPVRKALVRKFPYAIYYTSVDRTIFVIACFHGRRDPRSIVDRL